ncbi:uncharacterized protein LOC136071733 [Hydra vulgaris]|uniref:uncharacterized protein LOC136071733 n=1 Tax=Hydra vulgaris TaxID=6087 RepID=UPI0032E9D0F9
MYCGSIKPKSHLFLKDFSDELKIITITPFVVNDKSYMIQIYAFICDAPARSLLKEGNVDLRTNIEFLNYTYADRDHNGRCHQHEKSIFSEVHSLDFINMFTLDYMHLVCLGATRRILYFFKGGIKGTNHGKISLNMLDQISNSLLQINGKLPSDFARQSRSLSDLDRWKATEFHSFLLYYGIIVLKDIIDLRTYKHFLSLSISIRILCNSNAEFRNSNIENARRLIKYLVINSTEIFGQLFCVYNIHSLLHICDDVVFYNAPLDSLSAFPFENLLQQIKRLVRSKHNPISQICKRFNETNHVIKFEQKKSKINTNLKDGCFLTKHGVVFIKVDLGNDHYSCFYYRKDCMDNYFTHFLNSKDVDVYFLRSNVRHVVRVKHKDTLVNKCVCLPVKDGFVISTLLHNLF